MLKLKSLPILAGALATVAFFGSPNASATTLLGDITSCDVSGGGCPAGGTVTIADITGGVMVDVNLAPGEVFAQTGAGGPGNMNVMDFNLSGSPTISISDVTANRTLSLLNGGAVTSPPFMADGSGTYGYAVTCTNCGSGTSPTVLDSPISFDLTGSGLTSSSFVSNGTDILAFDVGFNCPGGTGCTSTGIVDVETLTPVVPAPVIGHGLLVLLAVGGVLFGGKLWENLQKRRSATA